MERNRLCQNSASRRESRIQKVSRQLFAQSPLHPEFSRLCNHLYCFLSASSSGSNIWFMLPASFSASLALACSWNWCSLNSSADMAARRCFSSSSMRSASALACCFAIDDFVFRSVTLPFSSSSSGHFETSFKQCYSSTGALAHFQQAAAELSSNTAIQHSN